ncbi:MULTISPECIES: GlxA family transcriptional regulator [unclassified Ruegeria]|uniref:GlxA family transcriptional regulator n=1 Tax=unclassified Ruegeria TaxID=2625375 RepID=UPI001489D97E|nr:MULTISPECIES: GlxA family transcriptional regulator [unclassified Ruegeria]NOD66051.1 helix-turn-helix domain-containing protein [Ruegeria sp. HKCCD7303]NOE34334.1 helix-turn-helix domain-containing protein [Ruegeria sp. HKCCD7318]
MYIESKPITRCRGGENPSAVGHSEIIAQKRHFYFLLLPGTNMLDFAAAIEPLRAANLVTGETEYTWSVMTETGSNVMCSNGIEIPTETGLSMTRHADYVIVCSGYSGYLDALPETLQWLRRHSRFGGRVAAIGTGAFTLARAGLATEAQLTLHWSLAPVFEEMFPKLDCLLVRVVADDSLASSAGGTASLDLTLSIIESDFDSGTAQKVADHCLHNFDNHSNRSQRQTMSKMAGSRNPAFLSILKKMEDSLQDPIPVDELIREEKISRRQIERLFNKHLKTSPSRHYRNLRLDRARVLLHGTDLSIIDVAVATGFASIVNFSKAYKARFGERPTADRSIALAYS